MHWLIVSSIRGQAQFFNYEFSVILSQLASDLLLDSFQDQPYSVKLLGRAWSNIVFLRGWDELMPSAESLRAEVEEEEEEGLGSGYN